MSSIKYSGRIWVALSVLFLIIMGGQIIFFADINLRNDEINTVHAADKLDLQGMIDWLGSEGTHPLGWRLVAISWVNTIHQDRYIIRYQSILFTLLALALIYRLGADLFDWQVGLMAVMFSGIMPFAFYHLHEFRPYAPLVAFSTAYLIVYPRWLIHHTRLHDLLFILVGAAGLQTHLYFGLICAAVVFFHLFSVPREKWQLKRLILVNVLILASFVWWLPTVINRRVESGEAGIYNVSVGQGLLAFIVLFNFLPFFAVFTPLLSVKKRLPSIKNTHPHLDNQFRHGINWRIHYMVIVLVGVTLMAIISNYLIKNLSPRNFLIVLPLCTIAVAYGLRVYLPFFRLLMLGIYIFYSLSMFTVYYFNYPYAEITNDINANYEENDKFILYINSVRETPSASMLYYLISYTDAELTGDDFYSIIDEDSYWKNFFFYSISQPYAIQRNSEPEALANFDEFLENVDRFWLIEYVGKPYGDDRTLLNPFLDSIPEYTVIHSREFKQDEFSYRIYLYAKDS